MNPLAVDQLSVNYDKTPVLWDLSLSIPEGKLVGIVGPNGAGKSTLLKAVLGLLKPLSGEVTFFGQPLKAVRRRVAYVPQRESVDWDFPLTLFDLVLMGLYGRLGLWRRPSRRDRARVMEVLTDVGLEGYAKRQISQLSGGQQQRAFLARALIQEADLFLLDEPFAGIDVSSAQVVISLLKQLQQAGKTLCVVHHDLDEVPEIFDWALLLNLRLVACGPVEEVFTPELLQRTYGQDNRLLGQVAQLSQQKTTGLS